MTGEIEVWQSARLMIAQFGDHASARAVQRAVALEGRAALQLMQEAAGAYRALVADLSDAERSKAWGEVYECLRQFELNASFQAKVELIIGSCARPS